MTVERVTGVLKRPNIKPTITSASANAENWLGESVCWASNNRPMLSSAGLAPHYHAFSDIPEVVTTPGLISKEIDAIGDAALEMANLGKS